jgi:hypothetical protein
MGQEISKVSDRQSLYYLGNRLKLQALLGAAGAVFPVVMQEYS